VVLMGCAVESPECYPSPWYWWAGRPDAIRLNCRGCGGTVMVVPIGNPRRLVNSPPLQWKRGQSSNMPRDEGSVLHVSLASRA
jgi:hypothetical protein